jgi:hypothetical protein
MRNALALGSVLAALLLSACAQPIPDSGAGFGAGLQGGAGMAGAPTAGFVPPPPVVAAPLDAPLPAPALVPPGGIHPSELAAAGIGRAALAPTAPGILLPQTFVDGVPQLPPGGLEADPAWTAPPLAPSAALPQPSASGISDEQDFDAVVARETIESDALRRQQQAAQYQVVMPAPLPVPPADTGPNIVEFALNAPNRKGQEWYSRFVFATEGRMQRNCADYVSADEAQRDFLARGGPERDPRGLDPDGDGFACGWDPAPFLAAVGRG